MSDPRDGRVRASNLVVSNGPGPQQPFWLNGCRLLAVHPAVPLNPATQGLSAVFECRRAGYRSPMTSSDDTKDCPRCEGRGKYADPEKGPLVQITCTSCDGSGKVPADAPDEPLAKEPTQVPFGSNPAE